MLQIVPSLGPMADEQLSKARSNALSALDLKGISLPPETVAYLVMLEGRYFDLKYADSRQFARETWEGRMEKP